MKTVTLIGLGRVGRALASALPGSKYRFDALVVRNKGSWLEKNGLFALTDRVRDISQLTDISSEIVIVATQDAEIEAAVREIEPLVNDGACVYHTSGSISSSALAPLRQRGAAVGSIHPLLSVAGDSEDAGQFSNAYFCVEGDKKAVETARIIVEDLGGIPFSIEADDKALYHASAVMACGHLTALVDASLEMLVNCGVSRELGKQILMPLIESTIRNLNRLTPSEALTGPFARADLETIDRHLDSLEPLADEQLIGIYLILGERSLDLALEQGADKARIERIRGRLLMAKSKFK